MITLELNDKAKFQKQIDTISNYNVNYLLAYGIITLEKTIEVEDGKDYRTDTVVIFLNCSEDVKEIIGYCQDLNYYDNNTITESLIYYIDMAIVDYTKILYLLIENMED